MASLAQKYVTLLSLGFLLLSSPAVAQQSPDQQPQEPLDDTVTIQNLNEGDPQEGIIDEPIENVVNNITTVRALDKITAHITELKLPQGEIIEFGTLQITARTCSSRPPEEVPETFAFLEIDDKQRNDELVRVFTGWMMASSPALNALEHPVYDIWVISCRTLDDEVSEPIE